MDNEKDIACLKLYGKLNKFRVIYALADVLMDSWEMSDQSKKDLIEITVDRISKLLGIYMYEITNMCNDIRKWGRKEVSNKFIHVNKILKGEDADECFVISEDNLEEALYRIRDELESRQMVMYKNKVLGYMSSDELKTLYNKFEKKLKMNRLKDVSGKFFEI
jgi:hypothetical protein